jgi:hypothetical protein
MQKAISITTWCLTCYSALAWQMKHVSTTDCSPKTEVGARALAKLMPSCALTHEEGTVVSGCNSNSQLRCHASFPSRMTEGCFQPEQTLKHAFIAVLKVQLCDLQFKQRPVCTAHMSPENGPVASVLNILFPNTTQLILVIADTITD